MRERTTDFVTYVRKGITANYYQFTADVPRHLPRSKEEIEALKQTLIEHFHVVDEPTTWYTLASEIAGTPRSKVKRSYRSLANVLKRLYINEVALAFKTVASEQINAKLREKVEQVISESGDLPAGT